MYREGRTFLPNSRQACIGSKRSAGGDSLAAMAAPVDPSTEAEPNKPPGLRGDVARLFPDPGLPEIGDRTEIMAGAFVLGPIKVGRRCFIGANAVVAHDLPDGSAYTPGRELTDLKQQIDELQQRVAELEGSREAETPGLGP